MSPVAVPADKRFRRAHVKPTRRRRWRALVVPAAKYVLIACVAGYALHRGGAVMAHARVLQIDRIVVHGNGRLSSDDVLTALDGLRGENLMLADLDAWRRRLLASPWVKEAAFRRSLPSTVEVLVSERSPMAIGRINRGLFLVDDRGMVIDEYGPQYADLDLPIVDGLQASKGEDDPEGQESRAQLAARLMAALAPKPDVARRLSEIDVADPHNVAVILSGDPAVIYVGEDRFLPRLESYIDLASELRKRVLDIDYVDLRFDDRIYVRPAAGPGKAKKPGAVVVPR